jgi:hypothetical protein
MAAYFVAQPKKKQKLWITEAFSINNKAKILNIPYIAAEILNPLCLNLPSLMLKAKKEMPGCFIKLDNTCNRKLCAQHKQ